MFHVVFGSSAPRRFEGPLASARPGGHALRLVSGVETSCHVDGGIGVVALSGELRVEGIPCLDTAVQEVRDAGALHVVLDLRHLAFMDSASAGALIRIRRDQREAGGRLVLFGLQRMVARLLDAAGLAPQFDIASDEEAARIRILGP